MSLGKKYKAGAYATAVEVLEIAFGKAENEAAFAYSAFTENEDFH
jgi:hypothetical protein